MGGQEEQEAFLSIVTTQERLVPWGARARKSTAKKHFEETEQKLFWAYSFKIGSVFLRMARQGIFSELVTGLLWPLANAVERDWAPGKLLPQERVAHGPGLVMCWLLIQVKNNWKHYREDTWTDTWTRTATASARLGNNSFKFKTFLSSWVPTCLSEQGRSSVC